METVRASYVWPGPDRDVLTLLAEPSPGLWAVAPVDSEIAVILELDDEERETGRIAGVELVGFLSFGRWDDLPELPMQWQLPSRKPLPLTDLLKRLQRQLRARASKEKQVA